MAVLCAAAYIIYSYFKTVLEFLAEEVINNMYSTVPTRLGILYIYVYIKQWGFLIHHFSVSEINSLQPIKLRKKELYLEVIVFYNNCLYFLTIILL